MGFKFEKVYSGGTGGGSGGTDILLDTKLTQEGQAADAKAVGDAIAALESLFANEFDGVKAVIASQILSEIGSRPIYGTVDDDKTITVSTMLPDGVYTLKYTNGDDVILEIGTVTIGSVSVDGDGNGDGNGNESEDGDDIGGESDVVYEGNLVRDSIDANGSVFNGNGYLNGRYASSSTGGPSSTEVKGFVVTGYMDLDGALVWYMKGATYSSDGNNRIVFLDEDFKVIAYISGTSAGGLTLSVEDGVTKFEISDNWNTIKGYKYVSMSVEAETGNNLIISKNPIV